MAIRVRKAGAERREEIARAALYIMAARGLTSLTTATLAEEVGLTSGALFRHFASLEEILREAARYALARIEETFPDETLPPLQRILELARNRVRLLGSDPGLVWLLRSQQAFLTLPDDSVELLRDLVERSRRYLLTAIREGIDNGRIRADIEPEVLLVPIAGTIHALLGMPSIHDVAADGGARDPDRVLAGLEVLLASSGQRSASPGGKKKTKRTRNTKRNANPSVSRRRRKT